MNEDIRFVCISRKGVKGQTIYMCDPNEAKLLFEKYAGHPAISDVWYGLILDSYHETPMSDPVEIKIRKDWKRDNPVEYKKFVVRGHLVDNYLELLDESGGF